MDSRTRSTPVESTSRFGYGPALSEKKHWATALDDIKSEMSRIRDLDLTEAEREELAARSEESTLRILEKWRRRSERKSARREASLLVEKIQNELYERHIAAFVREYFDGATEEEAERIRRQLMREAFFPHENYDGNDKVEALGTMLKGGLKGVRTRHRTRRLKKYASLLWETAKAIISVGSAATIYAILNSAFQAIVVSLLILTYTRVIGESMRSGMWYGLHTFATHSGRIETKKILRDETTLDAVSVSWTYEDTIETEVMIVFIIGTGLQLLNLLACYHLGKTLLSFLLGIY